MPRIVSGSRPAVSVENMLKHSPELWDQEWVRHRVKDGQKGADGLGGETPTDYGQG